jgi:CarboxypepD_reg-like domain
MQNTMDFVKRISLIILLSNISLFSQERVLSNTGSISGILTDKVTGDPLIGANVIILHTSKGAEADINGRYAITNVQPGMYTLVVSYIGYLSDTIDYFIMRPNLDTAINFALDAAPVRGNSFPSDLMSEAKKKADSLCSIPIFVLLTPYPISSDELAFSKQYGFTFIVDSLSSGFYKSAFNGVVDDCLEKKHGHKFIIELDNLWDRNHGAGKQ